MLVLGFVCRMMHPRINDMVGKLMGVAKLVNDLLQEYHYINDPDQCGLQLRVTQCYSYLMRIQYITKKCRLCSKLSKKHVELLLVNNWTHK